MAFVEPFKIDETHLKLLAALDDLFDYTLNYNISPIGMSDDVILGIAASWPSIKKGYITNIYIFKQFKNVLGDSESFKRIFLATLKDLRSIIHGRYDFAIPLYDGPPRRKIRD